MAVDNSNLVYLLDPVFQIEGVVGKPVVAGHIEVFRAGTDLKYITWQNFDGTKNPFKIPLNNDGRAVILVEPHLTYDIYVYDSFNNMVCSRLNVRPSCGGDMHISGGLYEGIDPIVVNNDAYLISANHVPLGVQEPLYFVQDDEEACIIGMSGGSVDPTEFIPWSASGNFQSAGDYVKHDDLSSYATEDWVEQQSYMHEYMESAFYPMTSNPSGYINDVSNLATKEELSAYTERTAFDAAIESINSGKLDVSSFSSVSSDFLQSADLDGYATENWVTAQGYLTTSYTPEFAYRDTAISSIDNSGLYDTSAHARITTLAGRISDLSSNKLDTTAFSDVSGTFLTAHQDLSDYQTTAGMTAYANSADVTGTAQYGLTTAGWTEITAGGGGGGTTYTSPLGTILIDGSTLEGTNSAVIPYTVAKGGSEPIYFSSIGGYNSINEFTAYRTNPAYSNVYLTYGYPPVYQINVNLTNVTDSAIPTWYSGANGNEQLYSIQLQGASVLFNAYDVRQLAFQANVDLKQDKLTFSYDQDNAISSINGSALAGGSNFDFTAISASANIELVEDNSALWISGRDWSTELADKQDVTAMTAYQTVLTLETGSI